MGHDHTDAGASPELVGGTFPEADQIAAIVAATGRDRQYLIDDFLRAKAATFRSIAHQLCRTCALPPMRHLDDVTQIVATECVVFINELVAHPERVKRIHKSFDGALWQRARVQVRTYADNAASGENVSGAVGLARRQRALSRTRGELRAALNREPTNEEILEATNERMRATRKDPARQGMLCSEEDLRADPVAYSLGEYDAPAGGGDDALLASHEAARTIAAVVKVAEGTSQTLGRVAQAWIGDLYNPAVMDVRTPAQIGQMLGMSSTVVSRHLAQLRVVARSYLAEIMAITAEVYAGAPEADVDEGDGPGLTAAVV